MPKGLNEQRPPDGIEWTRVWGRRGFTCNPITGCLHECVWQMPDGTLAPCYAKTLVESPRLQSIYPDGFRHTYYHPQRLDALKRMTTGVGVFLCSLSDLFGHWVDGKVIDQVLQHCRQTPQHIYFALTKNPVRAAHFDIPTNVWLGASSPPDQMYGRVLTVGQKQRLFETSLKALRSSAARVKWMSFEPLSSDYSAILSACNGVLGWAVIGAASKGRRYYAPHPDHFNSIQQALDEQGVPTFYKGNLRSLPVAVSQWRQDFPKI